MGCMLVAISRHIPPWCTSTPLPHAAGPLDSSPAWLSPAAHPPTNTPPPNKIGTAVPPPPMQQAAFGSGAVCRRSASMWRREFRAAFSHITACAPSITLDSATPGAVFQCIRACVCLARSLSDVTACPNNASSPRQGGSGLSRDAGLSDRKLRREGSQRSM